MSRFLWCLPLVALLGLSGCGKGNFSERAQEGKESVFRYPIVTNPTTLDPALIQDGDTIDILQQVYEGLTAWGEDNTVVPNLATHWEISGDGTVYTFHLKPGVKFHNSREVSAEDFKFAIERACDPATKSPVAENYLGDIVGVRDRLAGKAQTVSGVEVVDPATLRITIDKPRPYFLGKLTYPVSFVYAKEAVDGSAEIASTAQMIGTGPYIADKYVPDQILSLKANPNYHGGAPKIAGIERPIIKDPATRLNKYKSGELDLVMLERQDVAALQADPQFKDHLKFFNRPGIWYIGMNAGLKPFDNKDLRRAIAMAIDRDYIVDKVLGGLNVRADTIVPPGVLGHRERGTPIPYNPAAAKELLAKAGYPGGKGLPKLEMSFREQRPDIRVVAEAVASQLKENLGIDVSLRTMEWRTYLEKHAAKEMPFFHMRWAADYLDPENFLSLLLAGYGAENKIHYDNPVATALCREADSTMDEKRRLELYAQAEDLMLEDLPFIPIYFQRDAELIHPRISGLRESLFGHLPHTQVEIAPK